jgi:hypothetical protein
MAEPQPTGDEPTRMTPETFAQQWAQIRQHLRGWWDRLTEQDLDQMAGQATVLAGGAGVASDATWRAQVTRSALLRRRIGVSSRRHGKIFRREALGQWQHSRAACQARSRVTASPGGSPGSRPRYGCWR